MNTAVIPLNVGRPIRKDAKLSVQKRRKIIDYLLTNGYNISGAALSVKTSPQAIYQLIKSDETFKQAIQQVKDIYLDEVEKTSFTVALEATRDGFNDRKLLLQAHRKEYNPKTEIEITQTVTLRNATQTAKQILSTNQVFNKSIQEAEFDMIDDSQVDRPAKLIQSSKS